MRNYVEEFEQLIFSVRMSAKKPTGYEAILHINFDIEHIEQKLEEWRTKSKILGENFNSFEIAGVTFTVIQGHQMKGYILNEADYQQTIEGFGIVKRELTEEEKQRPITLDRIQDFHMQAGEDFLDCVDSLNHKNIARQFGGFAMAKRPELAEEIISTCNEDPLYTQMIQDIYDCKYEGEGNEFYEDFAEFLNFTKLSKEKANQVLIQMDENYSR